MFPSVRASSPLRPSWRPQRNPDLPLLANRELPEHESDGQGALFRTSSSRSRDGRLSPAHGLSRSFEGSVYASRPSPWRKQFPGLGVAGLPHSRFRAHRRPDRVPEVSRNVRRGARRSPVTMTPVEDGSSNGMSAKVGRAGRSMRSPSQGWSGCGPQLAVPSSFLGDPGASFSQSAQTRFKTALRGGRSPRDEANRHGAAGLCASQGRAEPWAASSPERGANLRSHRLSGGTRQFSEVSDPHRIDSRRTAHQP